MSEVEPVGGIGAKSVVGLIIVAVIILAAIQVMGVNVIGYIPVAIGIIVVIILATGVRTIRPTHRGIVERLGKFHRVQGAGLTWIIPVLDRLYAINITEQMTDAEKQEIITKDNLNAQVAALVRFKVRDDIESVKKSQYAVNNYRTQIVQLARTAMRNVIGSKEFGEVNSNRNILNSELRTLIQQEAENWGIEVVSTELKEIDPPKDVQDTMNSVIQANNKKTAAKDLAEAAKIEAEGFKNAAIQKAEGEKQSLQLRAEGEATAIKTVAAADAERIQKVFTAAKDYFTGGAVEYRRLQVTESSLQKNTKYILSESGLNPTIILPQSNDKEEATEIIPVQTPQKRNSRASSVDDMIRNIG